MQINYIRVYINLCTLQTHTLSLSLSQIPLHSSFTAFNSNTLNHKIKTTRSRITITIITIVISSLEITMCPSTITITITRRRILLVILILILSATVGLKNRFCVNNNNTTHTQQQQQQPLLLLLLLLLPLLLFIYTHHKPQSLVCFLSLSLNFAPDRNTLYFSKNSKKFGKSKIESTFWTVCVCAFQERPDCVCEGRNWGKKEENCLTCF